MLPLKRVYNTSVMSCDGINIDIFFFHSAYDYLHFIQSIIVFYNVLLDTRTALICTEAFLPESPGKTINNEITTKTNKQKENNYFLSSIFLHLTLVSHSFIININH